MEYIRNILRMKTNRSYLSVIIRFAERIQCSELLILEKPIKPAQVLRYLREGIKFICLICANEMSAETMSETGFNLLDFSDEILLGIFANFNDINLLNLIRVCKRFKAIAKGAFDTKYNGNSDDNYYDINFHSNDSKDDQKLYRTFVKTFGNEMIAMRLNLGRGFNRHKLLTLIGRCCRSTKYLIICCPRSRLNVLELIQSMSELISLTFYDFDRFANFDWVDIRFPHLKELYIGDEGHLDFRLLRQFLCIHQQLEHLSLIKCPRFPLRAIQALRFNMNRLKSLEYIAKDNNFGTNCREMKTEQPELLKISINGACIENVLRITAKQATSSIERLTLCLDDNGNESDIINERLVGVMPLFE
ncbi:uncharacterized protein LOC129566146 [Sitodiplosis mosellana]|uniref:uncharacterized protein LOC129566146 n=1 Tax=Sitodiplosis mosellana TaxID=263140 RepID=UPI002444F0D8|nr:uncharacterized protein LOC129566146 [Sitodiplosis mosellana]